MKIKIILVLALTITAMLALTSATFADGSELDGKWAGTAAAPDGNEYPVNFTFSVDGSKLTGSTSDPQGQGQVDIQAGKVAGDAFTFLIDVGGVKVIFTGKLHDHVCDIYMDYQGIKMHAALKKVSDE